MSVGLVKGELFFGSSLDAFKPQPPDEGAARIDDPLVGGKLLVGNKVGNLDVHLANLIDRQI